MDALAETAGVRCPRCQGFALREPGGIRCLLCGACYLYSRVLPRDHQRSGTDRRNRLRQQALDAVFMRPRNPAAILNAMLDRIYR